MDKDHMRYLRNGGDALFIIVVQQGMLLPSHLQLQPAYAKLESKKRIAFTVEYP